MVATANMTSIRETQIFLIMCIAGQMFENFLSPQVLG